MFGSSVTAALLAVLALFTVAAAQAPHIVIIIIGEYTVAVCANVSVWCEPYR
jgi:hypothetical protein